MTLTAVSIDDSIFQNYPGSSVGLLKVSFSGPPHPIDIPSETALKMHLESMGMQPSTYAEFPRIKKWRTLFQQNFKMNPKVYRPSVDALARRVIRGKGLPSILPLVDVYNLCSVQTLFPMGGYDAEKLNGELILRYGETGESFTSLHNKDSQDVEDYHVIYADDDRVVCWLWNHKDAFETRITEGTRTALFCIDSVELCDDDKLSDALAYLKSTLEQSGGVVQSKAILSRELPRVEF